MKSPDSSLNIEGVVSSFAKLSVSARSLAGLACASCGEDRTGIVRTGDPGLERVVGSLVEALVVLDNLIREKVCIESLCHVILFVQQLTVIYVIFGLFPTDKYTLVKGLLKSMHNCIAPQRHLLMFYSPRKHGLAEVEAGHLQYHSCLTCHGVIIRILWMLLHPCFSSLEAPLLPYITHSVVNIFVRC